MEGHSAGVERILKLVSLSTKYGIKVLTVFVKQVEVSFLMQLFEKTLNENLEKFMRRSSIIHNRRFDKAPEITTKLDNKSNRNNQEQLKNSFDYGGRHDIIQACQKLSHKVKDGVIKPEDIDETILSQELGTNWTEFPYPDLLIRTSGEQRISNFLMWQLAYTELHFESSYWPDFGEKEFIKALLSFQARNRRFGGTAP
ncbi:hypothetical protein MKW98_020649 [Papaver atlanticum]|uniref:Alkyl transferase n=1 Tax=Papaver atlanticum TaxID=357466 RepID=A0AAD4THP4_9MAGN|nr:hypothetical protein MKW98_020649 [Papaver atlanticum]